jgi:DHA3 family tetracycline resistance protein-like MFS transporter
LELLTPLRERDFALLWTGMTVSLLGDGIYFVAIAWQAYDLSNAPTALSVVGVAWTLPTVVFLLLGGAISDRIERRRVLLFASVAEALAIGAIGVLAVTGALQLWMLLGLVAVYGAGEAFFNPAFDAIVPTLVDPEQLTAASALDHFVRPLALQLLGPALGGALIALSGPGVRGSRGRALDDAPHSAGDGRAEIPAGRGRRDRRWIAVRAREPMAVGDAAGRLTQPAGVLGPVPGAVALPGQK